MTETGLTNKLLVVQSIVAIICNIENRSDPGQIIQKSSPYYKVT